jgi:hypothetical protein
LLQWYFLRARHHGGRHRHGVVTVVIVKVIVAIVVGDCDGSAAEEAEAE